MAATKRYCEKCGKMINEKDFYLSRNVEKYPPNGRMTTCKACLTMHVDNWDPETFKWILEEVDVPYIKEEWDDLLKKYSADPAKLTSVSVLGRYLAKMKLKQWKDYRYADSEKIAEKNIETKVIQMKAQGLSGEEIEQQLAMDRTPPRPDILQFSAAENHGFENTFYEEEDEFEDQLTEEDKIRLRLKWGRSYRADEWVRMEQLYEDMMNSYDIQSAGHKDTLIMICKASLKVNQLLDAGDIDGAQKMGKFYDSLMRSGKFTAAQNKEEQGEYVDSIGELVAICEKEGFIPKFYIDSPNDKVDRVIQDMQQYTHDLVTEELGLANLIENSIKSLERERESIKSAAEGTEDFEQEQEEKLFSTEGTQLLDSDFIDFFDSDIEEEDE